MIGNSDRSNSGSTRLIVNYDQILSTQQTNEILSVVARRLLDGLTPGGWERAGIYLLSCLSSGDFSSLCLYDPDVLDLQAPDQRIVRQVHAFFGKRADIDLGIDRQGVAWGKFQDAELDCFTTNACFRAWSQGRFQFRPDVERVLHAAQRKISRLLPDVPTLAELRPRFGPGATTQVPKKNACPVLKLRGAPACSSNFTDPAEGLDTINLIDHDAVVDPGVDEVAGGVLVEIHQARLAFVAKNAKTDRAICTEPALNGMFQAGLGELLASALKGAGIDIRDQSANQRAAMYGSISGDLATLDLSSASDTVSLGLVAHLFPSDWYDLFCRLRSAEVVYGEGYPILLQKVSSMGNGFTFPLETIVFWALAQAATDIFAPRNSRRVLVYGDDIIVPTAVAVPFMRILKELGFTPNPQKSFWDGDFRESCGKDYVLGIDVRPVYVDDALTGADFFRLHNWFWARGEHSLASAFHDLVHPDMRLYGPPEMGDGHFHRRDDEWMVFGPPAHAKKGWEGVTFESWTTRPKSLSNHVAERIAVSRRYKVPMWDPNAVDWSMSASCLAGYPVKGPVGAWHPTREQTVSSLEFLPRHQFLVRRLATYTQYLRETRVHTLTKSDAARSRWGHVYCDKRIPNPAVPLDDVFVVPGGGEVVRAKIYIFATASR